MLSSLPYSKTIFLKVLSSIVAEVTLNVFVIDAGLESVFTAFLIPYGAAVPLPFTIHSATFFLKAIKAPWRTFSSYCNGVCFLISRDT